MNKELKKKAKIFLNTYNQVQVIKAVEEMSELSKELCKWYVEFQKMQYTSRSIHKMDDLEENIAGELGDVYFMLYQIQILMGISDDDIDKVLSEKHLKEE